MSELKIEIVKSSETPIERAEWASPRMRIIDLSESEGGFTVSSPDVLTSS